MSIDKKDFEPYEDKEAFIKMLDTAQPNPFQAWEVQRDALALNKDYIALGTNAQRKRTFDEWAIKKRQTNNTNVQSFILLVQRECKEKLLYTEFKRQFRDRPEFGAHLKDKDKQRLYKAYQSHILRSPDEKLRVLKELEGKEGYEQEPLYIVTRGL